MLDVTWKDVSVNSMTHTGENSIGMQTSIQAKHNFNQDIQ